MAITVEQFQRRALLTVSAVYAAAYSTLPAAAVLHGHLVRPLTALLLLAAAALLGCVLRFRALRLRPVRLMTLLLLSGPLGPWVVARRTRRLRPLLTLRIPASARRG